MILEPNMIYIEFNKQDKRVTFVHHKPMLLLEEGMSDDVKNSPSAKEAYLREQKARYEAIGKFIPKENYEVEPNDGSKYRSIYKEDSNTVVYEKISDITPFTEDLALKLANNTAKFNEVVAENETLKVRVDTLSSTVEELILNNE